MPSFPALDAKSRARPGSLNPKGWLKHCNPVDPMDNDLHNVSSAVRADRFIAVG